MRTFMKLACVALAIALAPRAASAQVVASTFEQLQSGVKPGERIFVIDKTGVETVGTVQSLSPDVLTLTLKNQGERRFSRDDVVVIRTMTHDPVWNGAAIGAGVTGAFVLLSVGLQCGGECGEYLGQALLGAAIWGGGIGALVDAAILTPRDIFRTGPAHVDVHPTVGRDRIGAAVTIRW